MARHKPEIHPDPMPGDLVEDLVAWVAGAAGSTDLRELLTALERQWWRDRVIVCPQTRWRIPPELLSDMRKQVAQLVQQEFGGRWSCGAIVVRSDGYRFWTELGDSIVARTDWTEMGRPTR